MTGPDLVIVADGALIEIVGGVLSTVKVAVEAEEMFPAASITNSLYVPSVAGVRILVAVPLAVVIVAPAVKLVVPDGANQTLLVASPELTMSPTFRLLNILDANTVS